MDKLIAEANRLNIAITAEQAHQFELYYHELIEWNRKFNLTAVTDYEQVQVRHFLDSLTVALVLTREELARPDFNILDVGSGAGFPGMPLKILLATPHIVLLDSRGKRITFLQHLTGKLGLGGVEVVQGRAEEIARQPAYREQFSVVVSRAVAALPTLVELALPFCQVGGKFIAQKKGDIEGEVNDATRAIEILGGKLQQVKEVRLSEHDDLRYLVVVTKVGVTPERYPRRIPAISRRPLC